jgi:hypothetical protein
MSEAAKAARAANKAKAKRMSAGDPHAKVDASDWTPPEPLNTEAKTGLRPVSRRAFKKGGKVVDMVGEKAHKNAGRKARKSGGRSLANDIVNRNVKDANAEFGKPHIGGYKRGGHTDEKSDRALVKKMVKPSARTGKDLGGALEKLPAVALIKKGGLPGIAGKALLGGKGDREERKHGGAAKGNYTGGTRPTGGRIARKDGGRTKKSGKTNINIIIGAGAQKPDMAPMPPNMMAPVRPPTSPVPVPPPMPPQGGMPLPGAGAGLPPPPMARKSGGRVGNRRYRSFKDMDAGSGGGLGRLEKTEIQRKK